MYDARAQVITDALAKFGVTPLPRCYDPEALGNVTPTLQLAMKSSKINLTGKQVIAALAATRPVAIGYVLPPNYAVRRACADGQIQMHPRTPMVSGDVKKRGGGNPNSFGIAAWQIKEGEEKIVAERLVEIFSEAMIAKSSRAD